MVLVLMRLCVAATGRRRRRRAAGRRWRLATVHEIGDVCTVANGSGRLMLEQQQRWRWRCAAASSGGGDGSGGGRRNGVADEFRVLMLQMVGWLSDVGQPAKACGCLVCVGAYVHARSVGGRKKVSPGGKFLVPMLAAVNLISASLERVERHCWVL